MNECVKKLIYKYAWLCCLWLKRELCGDEPHTVTQSKHDWDTAFLTANGSLYIYWSQQQKHKRHEEVNRIDYDQSCVWVCTCACPSMCAHVCEYMSACKRTCMHACMCIRLYIEILILVHILTSDCRNGKSRRACFGRQSGQIWSNLVRHEQIKGLKLMVYINVSCIHLSTRLRKM